MKKLFKKITQLFCKHNWKYQYSRKVSNKYYVYWCYKCEKYKMKKIKPD